MSRTDEYIYELNSLSARIKEFGAVLRSDAPEGSDTVFSSAEETVKLWRNLENAVRNYLKDREDVSASEILYVLGAFYNYHIQESIKKYLKDVS